MPKNIQTTSTPTSTELPEPHDFHLNPDMSPPFNEGYFDIFIEDNHV